MPLSKRSYCHPKSSLQPSLDGRGFKPWPRGKEFSKYDLRDGRGHLPFLYESEVGKLETMRIMIGQASFLPVSTTSGYFGTRMISSSHNESSGPRKNRSCGQ